jgi:hypothetical protein
MAADVSNAAYYPQGLRESEAALIAERRRKAFASSVDGSPAKGDECPTTEKRHDFVGLALSGGGIRSATISLGLLQALAKSGLLKHFDYLSTVSGGGYIGGFLGGLYVRDREANRSDGAGSNYAVEGVPKDKAPQAAQPDAVGKPDTSPVSREKAPEASPAEVSETLEDPTAFETSWLRENGRYLAPAGAADEWAGFAVVLRNLLAIYVVLGIAILTFFLAAYAVRAGIIRGLETQLGAAAQAAVRDTLSFLHKRFWSPWILSWAIAAVVWAVPSGLAYWALPNELTEDGGGRGGMPPSLTLLLATFGAYCGVVGICFTHESMTAGAFLGEAALSLCVVIGLIALVLSLFARPLPAAPETTATELTARDRTTRWLRAALMTCTVLGVFALIDSLAEYLYQRINEHPAQFFALSGSGVSVLVAVGASLQKALGLLGATAPTKRVRVSYRLVATVVATFVALALLTLLDTVAQGLARGWGKEFTIAPWWFWPSLLAGAALTGMLGQTFPFLNRSSLSSLYAARLTRAYVGASNPTRRNQQDRRNITELLDGDVIPFSAYRPYLSGGPLHIINATLNETIDGKSQLEERDRRGMNLAIGPAGISVAARHHALWTKFKGGFPIPGTSLERTPPKKGPEFAVFPEVKPGNESVPEALHVGQWMAVSGAAISTALGSRTSIGLSLLLGLLNARLGRWWNSGVSPDGRGGSRPSLAQMAAHLFAKALPVQAHLLEELLARFRGTARRFWYLTDGGHFENTGAYELIRRQVAVIVLCDNGADPGAQFADLGGLVEKARTDFNAEIEFFDAKDIVDQAPGHGVGTLAQLGFGGQVADAVGTNAFAALATIKFLNGNRSLLLVLKPRITDALPLDVRVYHEQQKSFPQQSTVDQFFDEAQWESYRKLGFAMGMSVFGQPDGGKAEKFWPSETWRALKEKPPSSPQLK